jgi:polyribonucleotide nucleotidyltransferase
MRPLFPEGFYNEVQIVIHVLSLNPEVSADIVALIASSAALGHLRHPLQRPHRRGPRGLCQWRVCAQPEPIAESWRNSKMDLIVAGTDVAVLMVESEADQLS